MAELDSTQFQRISLGSPYFSVLALTRSMLFDQPVSPFYSGYILNPEGVITQYDREKKISEIKLLNFLGIEVTPDPDLVTSEGMRQGVPNTDKVKVRLKGDGVQSIYFQDGSTAVCANLMTQDASFERWYTLDNIEIHERLELDTSGTTRKIIREQGPDKITLIYNDSGLLKEVYGTAEALPNSDLQSTSLVPSFLALKLLTKRCWRCSVLTTS